MFDWLKHAFAVEPRGPAIPSKKQTAAIDAVCREIVRRQMTLPAQMMLESSAPLHFVTGQLLRFVEPFLGVLLDPESVREFASFLEKRGAVEYLCRRLGELEATSVHSVIEPVAEESDD